MTTLFTGLNLTKRQVADKESKRLFSKNMAAMETLFLNGLITEHEKKKIGKRITNKLACQLNSLI
tara:strand:+ start:72 stop:266 length:195 start_codon:yes stop_codon:yes gene_type:complete